MSAKQGSESEVLKIILGALEDLSKDSQIRLLKTAATFFDIGEVNFGAQETSGTAIFDQPALRPNPGRESGSQLVPSPKQFLMDKEPATEVERVACLAFYLAHFRDKAHFKTSDISQLNTEAAQSKLSNAAYAVSNATQAGYLAPAIKDMKQLSATGERLVEALPDRAKAEAVMKARKLQRKGKRQSGSGKSAKASN